MHSFARASELQKMVASFRREGRRIGLVPTMGSLHAGHYSLLDLARSKADVVVASVFVNPTQFGPNEDYSRYPRTPDADAAGLAAHRCDILFLPTVEEMYPYGAARSVRVSVPDLSETLEGALRPGHFDGVATIVTKLFNLVQPEVAVFGRKDYQQLLVIRRLVRDLGYPIEILDAPIVREPNGLAMSSRNQYLGSEQRDRAGAIHATLQWMREQVLAATAPLTEIEAGARMRLVDAGLVPEYVLIRRAQDLGSPDAGPAHEELVGLVAARSESVRLIDNLLLQP